MTNNDILSASLLDIVFDNRNKQYGAYELRRHYNQRMIWALGLAIGLTGLMLFLSLQLRETSTQDLLPPEEAAPVRLIDLIVEPPPAEPKPQIKPVEPQPPSAQKQFTSKIHIVADKLVLENAIPPQIDLIDVNIGTENIEGPAPTTIQQSPTTENGTGTAPAAVAEEKIYDFTAVEEAAEFPGGKDAFQRFLARHLQTPEELAPGEHKTVQVRFVIQKDGAVLDMAVLRSAGARFDNEVLRVLKKAPKWKPARQNGQHVSVAFVLPVTFVGSEE